MRRVSRIVILLIAVTTFGAEPRRPALEPIVLDLPGPPASVVATDLDGDSRRDLLVVSAYTSWGQVSSDRVEDAVLVTEVVPALFDRREAHAWLAKEDGTYEPVPALPLGASVHHVEKGPTGFAAIALVDGGLATLRVKRGEAGPRLVLERVLEAEGVLDGTEAFLPALGLVADGGADLLFPAEDGLRVYRIERNGLPPTPTATIRAPGGGTVSGLGAERLVDIPRVEDVNGDGIADIVVVAGGSPPEVLVAPGLGAGRFGRARTLVLACTGTERSLSHFGDIDGDGRAEVVVRQQIDTDRGSMKKMKEPRSRYRFHRVDADLTVDAAPYLEIEIPGYASSGGFDGTDPDFKDLDGDGRKDLVALTLDFSIFQALRVLTTKRVSIGVDFVVWVQQEDGTFREADNRGLDEKLKLDLNDFRVGRMAQFAGDFDGDGRIDFVHLGRGKSVTVHLGRPGGLYPQKADLAIELAEEPQDLGLVRVRDLDGDGRADLAITRTGELPEEGASRPARLMLLLSANAP